MITLLGEARVLLEKAFGFANVAASKVRRSVAAPARGVVGLPEPADAIARTSLRLALAPPSQLPPCRPL